MTQSPLADQIEAEILSGALPPGTPLNQTDLATRFGVSRIPVRDALAQLTSLGVITSSPNRTATVLKLDTGEVEELYDMRIQLECDLLGRAIPLMDTEALAAVDYALERSSLEAHQDNWAQGDQIFHNALYAPAGRLRQMTVIDELRRAARVQIAGYGGLTDKTKRWLREHQGIVTACHAGDSKEATRLLRKHLRGARNHLLRAMRSE